MALRIFRCRDCAHLMRFGARKCGRCWTSTPMYNRTWFCVAMTVFAAAGLGGLLAR